MRNQVISRDQQKLASVQSPYQYKLPFQEYNSLLSIFQKQQAKSKINSFKQNENSQAERKEEKGQNSEYKRQSQGPSSSQLGQKYNQQAFVIKNKDDMFYLVLFVLVFFVAVILAPNQFCNSKN